jgi:UDP-N-acetylmuramate--alanine ligase
VCVFQPHRYTRTFHLYREFLTAFNQADVLLVMDVYGAGEPPMPGVSAETLADDIRAHGHRDVAYVGADKASVVEHLVQVTRPGDLVLTLGAGDVSQVGPELLLRLERPSLGGRTTC